MVNDKLQINIPVSSMKNATQRRTRTFLCCSCLGPKESMSDSAITVTLGKYDECEYVVEKLAIKRIPTRLMTNEEIVPDNVEKNPSETTTQSAHLDFEDASKKKQTGITYSSYYKMVPNKLSPDKIPKMREQTESSIITLSDSKNMIIKNDCDFNSNYEATAKKRYNTLERNYGDEWEIDSHINNIEHSAFPLKTPLLELQKFHSRLVDKTLETDDDEEDIVLERNVEKYLEPIEEKVAVTIDPLTKKTLQILGGAPAAENIHKYYHNFSKGPVRCAGQPGIVDKYIHFEECQKKHYVPKNVKKKYDVDTDDQSATSANVRQRLKWKILIKHHEKNKRSNKAPPLESTTELCSDSEF